MSSRPSETSTQRYQLPIRPPLRLLLMASLSATVGALEVIAWAAFGLPSFWLQAGITLLVVGLGLGAWAWIVDRGRRWILYVGPGALTVVRGSRRSELPWSTISAVRVVGPRLVVLGRGGGRQHSLRIPPETIGSEMLTTMLQAIDVHLAGRA